MARTKITEATTRSPGLDVAWMPGVVAQVFLTVPIAEVEDALRIAKERRLDHVELASDAISGERLTALTVAVARAGREVEGQA
jgi:hypothetical protein